MRAALVIVPHVPPFSPPLGIALVSAQLRARGHEVALVDLASAALESLWTPSALDAARDTLGNRGRLGWISGRGRGGRSG